METIEASSHNLNRSASGGRKIKAVSSLSMNWRDLDY